MIKSLNSIKSPIVQLACRGLSTNGAKRSFEEAIVALNSLQTNSMALSLSIQMKRQQKHDEANFNLRDTEKYLERIEGFNLQQLDNLSVIHVSGSKGKGSVCTYTDAILREYNVKTGLFTSPHLMSVTERIKLMGLSISKSLFNKYFWEVYDALQAKMTDESDLPSYFKFLQVMAFYIFVKEKVDVAVIEVGIGGQFDSTNIIRNTEIVGITALQLEHTQLLGNTVEEIAWQKAGIIKRNSHVYSMQQPIECSKVIEKRFLELEGKSLSFLPPFNDYSFFDCNMPDFSHTSEVNRLNFSLASQLAARWLRNRHLLSDTNFDGNLLKTIEKRFVDAFEKCHFDGRFQRIEDEGMTFYLDGAHTIDSMKICSEWFAKQVDDANREQLNVLVFNVTGDRDSELILRQLYTVGFDVVCFCTNILDSDFNEQSENFTGVLKSTQIERCLRHKDIWLKFHENSAKVSVFPTIQSAIDFVRKLRENNTIHVNALFTGSLHLVGGSLKIIHEMVAEQKTRQSLST